MSVGAIGVRMGPPGFSQSGGARALGSGGFDPASAANAGVAGPQDLMTKVMEILRKKDVEICPNWNRRFKDNLERIKTGSLYEVATVLRKLVLLQKERNLSFGEKKMLESVRQLLVSEISHAVGIDEGDARSMVDRTIAKA